MTIIFVYLKVIVNFVPHNKTKNNMKRMYFAVIAIGMTTAIGCSKNNPVPTMEVNNILADDCNCGIITKVVNVHTYDYPDSSGIESTMMVRNECSGVVEKFIIDGDHKGKESGYICFDEAW